MSASFLLKHSAQAIPLKVQAGKAALELFYLAKKPSENKPQLSLDQYGLNSVRQNTLVATPNFKWLGVFFALLAHVALLFALINSPDVSKVALKDASPMMVNIIAPPAPEPKLEPEPEVVPIIKPKKVIKKAVVKPKKIVKKIVPVENPVQVIEAATAEMIDETLPVEEAAVMPVEESVAATASPAVVEEVVEPPKFGVAYLNNPSPRYPRISRRKGEEGRVLLKVLVSAEGAAQTTQIEKSSGFSRLDQAALSAVKRWRFVPARKGDNALSAYVLVPISFSLGS